MFKEIIIGRSNNVDITLTDRGNDISRKHLSVVYLGDNNILVKDLGSTNGTFYQELRLVPNKYYELKRSHHIRLGKGYYTQINDIVPWVSSNEIQAAQIHFQKINIEKYKVGRLNTCDIIIIDDKTQVSREHLEIGKISEKRFFIKDLGSNNGTLINNYKLPSNINIEVTPDDTIVLGKDYELNLNKYFSNSLPQKLKQSSSKEITLIFGEKKKITINPTRITLGELSTLTDEGFKTGGRTKDNDIVLNHPDVSRKHFKIRQLSGYIFEIIDLGSTNKTFIEGTQIKPYESVKFQSNANIILGKSFELDLNKYFRKVKYFPEINFKERKAVIYDHFQTADAQQNKAFQELRDVWEKYRKHRKEIALNSKSGINIAGTPVEILAKVLETWFGFAPGIGVAVSVGGFVLQKFLKARKKKRLSNDLCYEDIFLELYCCPNCNFSFGFTPWSSIRYCTKCKVKYRDF